MDLGSIIIGLICFALFVVPIIYIQSVQKNKSRKFFANFINLATQQQLVVAQSDLWKNCYAIGIDTKANKLFYLKKSADTEQKVLINLSEVESCSVVNINRNINNNKIIDRLELLISFHNNKLPKKALEFFNREDNQALNDELRLTEKWRNIINMNLETSKKSSVLS